MKEKSKEQDLGKKEFMSEDARTLVEWLIKSPQRPVTAKDLCQRVFQVTGEEVSEHMMRKFLKTELKYSFK